jgi:hypothetical protein
MPSTAIDRGAAIGSMVAARLAGSRLARSPTATRVIDPIGLLLTLAVGRVASTLLYGLTSHDPFTLTITLMAF